MTETRFYEPARLSSPSKHLFSLTPLDTTTWLRSLLSKGFLLLNLNSFRILTHVAHDFSYFLAPLMFQEFHVPLYTGLSIMTVNISWNFKERMVHKLPFFLGFSVVLANSCKGSLQKKDSLLFIFGCKGFLKCNYFRNWCIIYSRGNSFRNSHAFLTTR